MNAPQVIETDRLRLRVPVMEDASLMFAQYAQDTEVTRYLSWRPHRKIETVREFLRFSLTEREKGKWLQWVITTKDQGQLIGTLGIKLEGHKAELGYVLSRAYWGRGYMTEAAKALVEWVMKQGAVYRIWAVCDVENLASARVMEKIGMQREGVLHRWIVHPNRSDEPRDCYCYAITK